MGRILGLDLGSKTIGIALSDPLKITSQGLTTLKRTSHSKELARLKELIREHAVQAVVVGLPKNMDGSIGPQWEKAIREAERLERELDLPVSLWDERLTTVEAEKTLLQADLSRSKRKKVIDKMAAQLILQGYLDRLAVERDKRGQDIGLGDIP
jgi:putative Holliday junction resolvase